ncbi:FAD/NAD(P)-binding protein [Streptomyces sp. NPDC049577]|uniref:FAD/NAD(P)-binding protein n=1 Tax=Streptomyces sp. NPDC049577 TaxID=3155153 RepID=UPI00341D909F
MSRVDSAPPPMPHAPRPSSLGVVGAGGAATALLHALAEQAERTAHPDTADGRLPRHIVVFERSGIPGPGAVYQEDLDSARINREADHMSVSSTDLRHFATWRLENGTDGDPFPGRGVFGGYLRERFATAVRRLRALGTAVDLVHDEVVNLLPTEPIRLITRSRRDWTVDELVLAMGNPPQPDLYHLHGAPDYHREPFPLTRLLAAVPSGASVAVLGTGLAAVDIAIALSGSGHRGPVHLLSRTGMLPRVRAALPPVRLTHFTPERLVQRAAGRPGLDLRDLAELLQRDAGPHLPPLAGILRRARRAGAADEVLRAQLAGEQQDIAAWQQVLAATNPAVEHAWRLLRPDARNLLFQRYHRPLTNLRNPMPPVNARLLLDLMDAGALHVRGGLLHVGAYANGPFYTVLAADRPAPDVQEFDVVISAVGPDPGVGGLRAMPLTASLVNQGLARPHRYGGLTVTPDQALVGADGRSDPRIRIIGNLTAGTFYYTSSMEMVARQAERLAGLLRIPPADRHSAAPLEVAA